MNRRVIAFFLALRDWWPERYTWADAWRNRRK
jgi:hypothetical protein